MNNYVLIRDVSGYPKPDTRNPKPGLFFDPKPETRPEENLENPTRNPTFSIELFTIKRENLASWPSKFLKIFACGAEKGRNLASSFP